MKTSSLGDFLSLLFGSFFRWWWAVTTGVASILSYLSVPSEGVKLGRLGFAVAVLIGSAALFMCATVVYQGWSLFRGNWHRLNVLRWHKSTSLGAEFAFLIDDRGLATSGTVAELRRFHENIEVAFGLVEFVERDSNERMQAREVWLEPAHVRDSKTGHLPITDIIVRYPVTMRTVEQYAQYAMRRRGGQ